MIKHSLMAALVVLLVASLAFAATPIGTVTYGEGDISTTPAGMVVEESQLTEPMYAPAQAAHSAVKRQSAAVQHTATQQKAAVKQTAAQQKAAAQRAAASAQATQAATAASLKKGEPAVRVNTTTTTTDVYDMSVTNKKGTTDYGVAQQTVTNAQGQSQTQGVIYSSYAPSKTARANAKGMEVSLAGGATMFYNKDSRNDRYGKIGLAGNLNALKEVTPHLSLGADYMMLHPGSRSYDARHYHGIYAHNISVAGKFTLNPWDSFQVYVPMGGGMMNARMKTVTGGSDMGDNKWGASMYAGLGLQYDITAGLFAGVEYRYTYGWISDKDITPYHKDRNLQFHNVLLRVGMRF